MTNSDADLHSPFADSMRVVGEAYLHRYPGERSRTRLLGALQPRDGLAKGSAGVPTPQVLSRLVTQDFSTDNVVYLNGWVLSRTEARLAALTVV